MMAATLVLIASQAWHARPSAASLDLHARRYVSLALALRRFSPSDVDGYFGPPDLAAAPGSLPVVRAEVQALAAELASEQTRSPQPRQARLLARVKQLDALLGLIAAPRARDFDADAAAVFGLPAASALPAARIAAHARARQQLAALLPGAGPLAARLAAYRQRFLIPPDKREAVFARALAECRARTRAHWPLPADEAITIAWTSAVPAAWHHYLGQHRSGLQINPAAVADPAAALDLACHEAYPGHHAQFLLMDAAGGVAVEDQIVLLRSPQSILREGAANHGIALAFPPAERAAFMASSLFPLAGLAASDARRHAEVHRLMGQLSTAMVPILSRYRDGSLARQAAMMALADEALVSSPTALLDFFDAHGALLLGYSVAQERVEANLASAPDRWQALARTLQTMDLAALQPPSTP
jgi:hypothetical protein